MTNAEKQEIIEAVLAALATNSKTIAQLSPKQSLTDSDLFEVAGGSRVTYLVLKNAIREGLALASQLSDYLTEENAAMYLAKLDTETGTIDFRESPCVMLDGFKDVNGYTPVTGDLFYENRSGYQIWTKTQGGATGEHANTHVAYINRNENAFYRWTGTKMERIGGGVTVINDLTTGGEGDALSAEMGKILKTNIEFVNSKVNTLLNALANIAFKQLPKPEMTELDWGENTPSLTSPQNGAEVNVGTIPSDGTSVTKAITIKGKNLESAVNLAISGTGFSLSANSVSAADANAGTTVTVTYTDNGTGDGLVYGIAHIAPSNTPTDYQSDSHAVTQALPVNFGPGETITFWCGSLQNINGSYPYLFFYSQESIDLQYQTAKLSCNAEPRSWGNSSSDTHPYASITLFLESIDDCYCKVTRNGADTFYFAGFNVDTNGNA